MRDEMNEATGVLTAREGLTVVRGGQTFVMVRITEKTPTHVWSVWHDGESVEEDQGPHSRADYDRYATGDGRTNHIGGLGFLPEEYVRADKPANPKQAFGDKKLPLHLVPAALEIGAAKAFGEGAVKYGAYNWRETKVETMTYVGAIKRHLAAYIDGEDVDPESTTGKLHLEGIAACVGILLDVTYSGTAIDNRPPKGPAPERVRTPK